MTDAVAVPQISTATYKGDDRRHGVAVLPAGQLTDRRGIATPVQSKTPGASQTAPAVPVIGKPQVRAKFVVSEKSITNVGVSRLVLSAVHDSSIAPGSGLSLSSSNPKGSITLEVDPKFADTVQMGAAFYLISA